MSKITDLCESLVKSCENCSIAESMEKCEKDCFPKIAVEVLAEVEKKPEPTEDEQWAAKKYFRIRRRFVDQFPDEPQYGDLEKLIFSIIDRQAGEKKWFTEKCARLDKRRDELLTKNKLQAEEIKRLKEENRWIAVSERMPKNPTQYLCCYSPYSGELPQMYFATTWSKAKGFFLEDGRRVFPTHWKPIILPKQD